MVVSALHVLPIYVVVAAFSERIEIRWPPSMSEYLLFGALVAGEVLLLLLAWAMRRVKR